MFQRVYMLLMVFGALLCNSVIHAQDDAAFDVNEIASAVVRLENIDKGVVQSGVFITADGLIVSANVDFLIEPGDIFEISTFTSLEMLPEKKFIGEAVPVEEFDTVIAIQVTEDADGNPIDPETLELPHLNPIVSTVTVNFLDTVFTVGYPSVGSGYLTTTRGQITAFDKVSNFVTDNVDESLYYQSDVTTDFEGLGSLIVNFAGQFVGIAVELPIDDTDSRSDDILVQIAPVTSMCATIRAICNEIMGGYRPTPENRIERPGGRYWLTDGIGLTTGGILPRGEVEVDYYCEMLGLRARVDAEETVWECFSPSDEETRYTLKAFDYDLICQQTYRNPEAVAIQDGSKFIPPAMRWRCYG